MATCNNSQFPGSTVSDPLDCTIFYDEERSTINWKYVFTAIVIICMLITFRINRFGPDSISMGTVAILLCGGIINTRESVEGFSNLGLLTIMLLTIISDGITRTGAMDWYLGKLLNRPKTAEWAQVNLMLPICLASGVFSSTQVVAAAIPIVQKWSQQCGISPGKLMMPLSFAALLGGTLTLFGSSTNLIVYGLIRHYYPYESAMQIEFFELSKYGICLVLSGMSYVFLSSRYLLVPETMGDSGDILLHSANLLLGAKVTPWSPAVGRTIKRSGLRDTGGIYLVSVKRAATGNVHYAVSVELVLGVGDILYFTGLVGEFFDFCEEHGLEIVTNAGTDDPNKENDLNDFTESNGMVGVTRESLLEANEEERFQIINRISDIIRGGPPQDGQLDYQPIPSNLSQVIATIDHNAVIVCIDAADRAALLLDIARELHTLRLELHHTEAAVVSGRSLSIWRCEPENIESVDLGEIWSILHHAISSDAAIIVPKKRGLRVVRARVIRGSKLINKIPTKVRFRETFKAGIITIQSRSRRNTTISESLFEEGDILVLQPSKDSPLLQRPPSDFYSYLRPRGGQSPLPSRAHRNSSSKDTGRGKKEDIWTDLQVIFNEDADPNDEPSLEFLTAMEVSPNSKLVGTSICAFIDKLPNLSVVGIERPTSIVTDDDGTLDDNMEGSWNDMEPTEMQKGSQVRTLTREIRQTESLKVGDILWFSGPSSAVSELRKVPGLISYQSEDVKQMNDQAQKRRLVQAVVALHGPLVGKSVKDVRFRTRFGAAVIAVHRDGDRINDHPGQITLQAGDALLLEAGPTFEVRRPEYDASFALVTEINKTVPRNTRLLLPAGLIVAMMVILVAANALEPYASVLVSCVLMVIFGVLSEHEIQECLKWDTYVASAASFAIGTAIVNSGLAHSMASDLASFCRFSSFVSPCFFGMMWLLTFVAGNVVTNNVAAPMIFPIAMKAAVILGLNRKTAGFAIMLSASFNSITPYGSKANLLVCGPGGYKYKDYIRFAGPLQLVLFLVVSIIIPLL